MMVGYHGHAETGPLEWEEGFSYAKFNGANLDIGHFVAGHNVSPVPFLKAHYDRITHIHVKDRKLGTNGGQNVPFGQGDTPIKEVLQLIRDNKWNIQATIEFEYPRAGRFDADGRAQEVRGVLPRSATRVGDRPRRFAVFVSWSTGLHRSRHIGGT